MMLGRSLATNMKQNMENTAKYDGHQPEQREKYKKTIDKYEKVMKVIKGREASIVTEDAVMSDSMKNIQMRKFFIFVLFVIIGTIAVLYLFGKSIIMTITILTIYYIALYLFIVVKQDHYYE